MRRITRLILPVAVAASAAGGACTNPGIDNHQADDIQALTQSVNELKEATAELQNSLDSANRVILKQDTALRLIVDFTGAQVPSYRPHG